MLGRLRAAGASLLLTTHQLEEAEARCDRIVIIDRGRVIESGTLAELVARTVGARRQVALTLDRAPATPIPGFNGESEGAVLRAQVADIATELPALIQRAASAGARVQDVEVHAPSLQNVFLHLTGRELRE
jgi:ABC-2 type transport system ATP-binding protein